MIDRCEHAVRTVLTCSVGSGSSLVNCPEGSMRARLSVTDQHPVLQAKCH